jgi:ABC-type bacteriocin/lantibiotic exporter with double-glycine peptidase domain
LQSIETIKSGGLEAEVFAKWADQQTRLVASTGRLDVLVAVVSAVPFLITMLTAVAIMIIGALAVIDGSLSLGGLVAFQALAIGINGPIGQLVGAASQVQTITINLERIDDALDNPIDGRYLVPPIDVEAQAASLRPLSGSVRFEDVEFSYDGGEPIVQGLSFELEPGSRVALVGTSGAGKTTIGNLAAGLLIPQSGSITYDGRKINQIAPAVLGSQLAKVDQTIMLFKGTVRENVTFWDATISDDLVIKALRDAQILDMVLARPGGLDGEVAEGGVNFSGGERQRLEIARALVRSPSFLVLDEATSALDTVAEFAVDCAIRARGCSCLIIAHRLSTIRDADEIVLLARGGAVSERGTHDELIALGGLYAELVESAGSGGDVGT